MGGLQATADLPDVVQRVQALKDTHPDFSLTNPNRCRSLVAAFALNAPHFHAIDGSGYDLIADAVSEIDGANPQLASRLARAFGNWRRYGTVRGSLMKDRLERLAQTKLSDDTFEVVSRALKTD